MGPQRARSWGAIGVLVALMACDREEGGPADPSSDPVVASGSSREAATAGPRVSVLLDSRFRPSPELRKQAREHGATLEVLLTANFVDQLQAVDACTLDPVEALLVQPVVPNALQRTMILAREAGVPLVALDRGANTEVSWVGLASDRRSRELGRRSADLIPEPELEVPRVFVVEDAVWTESRQRVDQILAGLGESFQHLEVVHRLAVRGPEDGDLGEHTELLASVRPVHMIVAGGTDETQLAISIRDRVFRDQPVPVAGASSREEAWRRAVDDPARHLLLAYRTEDMVREALTLAREDRDQVQRVVVPCWIAGLEDPP